MADSDHLSAQNAQLREEIEQLHRRLAMLEVRTLRYLLVPISFSVVRRFEYCIPL
jgi:hypothetical protein